MAVVVEIVIFDGLKSPPMFHGTIGPVERRNEVEINISLSSSRRRADGSSNSNSQNVSVCRIKSHSKRRCGYSFPTAAGYPTNIPQSVWLPALPCEWYW